MSVFALHCRQCGELVDIPGRFGFKLKNAGVDSTICQGCRQKKFLDDRDRAKTDTNQQETVRRRWIPVVAGTIAAIAIATGLIIQRQSMPQPTPQDTSSEADVSR